MPATTVVIAQTAGTTDWGEMQLCVQFFLGYDVMALSKYLVWWSSFGFLRHVAVKCSYAPEERSASIFRATELFQVDARKNCLFCRLVPNVWTIVATKGGKRGYHYLEPMELRFATTAHLPTFQRRLLPPFARSVHSAPGDRNILNKMWMTASRYDITWLKIWTFTDAAVRTSNLTDPLVFRYRPQSIPQSVFHSWKTCFWDHFESKSK
jgi:hypothetical protein